MATFLGLGELVVLLPLAAVGFLLALYFTLLAYRVVRPDSRWLPEVCRLDEGTCARIVDTKEARVLGPPNSVFGLGYYGALLVLALMPHLLFRFEVVLALLLASTAAALLSVYLAWALLRKLRVVCVLCFVAHGINLVLAAVFWVAFGLPALGQLG